MTIEKNLNNHPCSITLESYLWSDFFICWY